jgi:hypothetical protein
MYKNMTHDQLEARVKILERDRKRLEKVARNEVVNGYRYTRRAVAQGGVESCAAELFDLERYLKLRTRIEAGLTLEDYKAERLAWEREAYNRMEVAIARRAA